MATEGILEAVQNKAGPIYALADILEEKADKLEDQCDKYPSDKALFDDLVIARETVYVINQLASTIDFTESMMKDIEEGTYV